VTVPQFSIDISQTLVIYACFKHVYIYPLSLGEITISAKYKLGEVWHMLGRVWVKLLVTCTSRVSIFHKVLITHTFTCIY